MGVFDDVQVTPAKPAGGVFSSVAAPAAKVGGVFAKVTATPKAAPAAAPAAPSPYFQGKEPTGSFVGISDETDPFSGRPYLAYTPAGANATTTDKTRTAPLMNPEVAAPTIKSNFENPRMPESASQQVRAEQGATSEQQLDHRMALALGGSNDSSNLKLIPTADNQAASTLEGQLPSEIAGGKISLFDAQLQEAKAKGLPLPFTDQAPAPAGSLWDKLTKGAGDLVGAAKTVAEKAGSEAMQLAVGAPAQDNTQGLANLQQVSNKLDSALSTLGTQGDALQKMKDDLDATTVDQTSQASVDAYNQKVNVFNDALKQYNFKQPQAQKMVDLYSKAVDAYNGAQKIPASGLYNGWSDFLKQNVLNPYLQAVTTAGIASAQVTANLSNPDGTLKSPSKIDWTDTGANELKLVAAGLNAVADPGMVPYQVANAVPVAGHILDPVNWIFQGAGAAGGDVTKITEPLVNALPISSSDKEDLNDAIQQTGYTLAQFAVGAYLFGRAGKAVEMRANPATPNVLANFKDLTIGDVKDIVSGTKKFAEQVKARLPQSLAEAKRGFIHIPGLGDLPEEGDVTPEKKQEEEPEKALTEPLNEPSKPLDGLKLYRADAEKFDYSKVKSDGYTPGTYFATNEKYATDYNVDGKRPVSAYNLDPNAKVLSYKDLPESLKKSEKLDANTINESKNIYNYAKANGYDAVESEVPTKANPTKNEITVINPEMVKSSKTAAPAKLPPTNTFADLLEQVKQYKMPIEDFMRKAGDHYNLKDPDTRTMLKAVYDRSTGKLKPGGPVEPPAEETKTGKFKSAKDILAEPRKVTETENKTPLLEHNGGMEPPVNKGGMQPPEVDWSQGKDIAAIRQSTDTMERTIENVFPKETAKVLNEFLTEADRRNEAAKVRYVDKLRKDTKKYVVDELGIKPATTKSALVQRFGEGRMSLDELKKEAPKDYENIGKAAAFFKEKYNELIDDWNKARNKAGLKPITKRPNYFRHFIDLSGFAHMYGLDFRDSNLPTAISGITEFFRSQAPWTNAAMRRLGSETTDDAVGGFDNYLDTVGRAIFHTDTVQRGRLMDKYLRGSADANTNAAQDIRDSGEDKDTPPPINLSKFANTLKQWTDRVSGKQNIFDRTLESMVGRTSLAVMRAITRQFGLNVIGGNLSAAATHIIPINYTFATTDKVAIGKGLVDMTMAPFLEDFTKVDGQTSDFLTRRFGKESISPTLLEKAGAAISAPFHWVDQFISRLTVSSKYFEAISKGLAPDAAMKQADAYASRVVGDRSSGNLPPLMSTKTLGFLTQFQIEVNDNLHVLTHDIPTWEQGNKVKIAMRFAQFAVFAYLTNQMLQYMKGSGKGLDPIDMGLTLAGLNDEGHDQDLMTRLGLVGTDLLKELPFTSVFTGGQIPAFVPLQQAGSDLASGNFVKGLEQLLVSFASPIGGGAQVQKSLTAIQAWRQGYVTDAQGHITATVPQTIPELAQGVAFGKSAFPTVKKSNTEITTLDAGIKAQQAAGKLKDKQASALWKQLQGMPAAQAKTQLQQIAATDPDMAKRVIAYAKQTAAGITKTDILIKSLGVANGGRAQYIAQQLSGMTDAQKKSYLLDLAGKKILTAEVLAQLVKLLKKS